MRMNKEKEIVPKLRFPEFQGNDIDFVHGNRLFGSISNKNHNSDLPILAITQDQGAVPRDQIEYNVTVTDKSLSNYKVVEVGDFATTKTVNAAFLREIDKILTECIVYPIKREIEKMKYTQLTATIQCACTGTMLDAWDNTDL